MADKDTAPKAATTKAAPSKAIADPKPATEAVASGAVMEDQILDAINMKHPAVDDNPREGTSANSNRVDFNDPTLTQDEAVVQNLKNA